MEKRQKIRGLALGLLCAAFALSGCERSEEEPLALLTLDKERIVFDNPAEGETAQAVLRKATREIIRAHMAACVTDAVAAKDAGAQIDELVDLFDKMTR